MNKLMNKKEDYVLEMLHGIEKSSKNLGIDAEKLVIYNKENDKSKVNLISGGGAGHEPAHAGYVGKGMLSAAVSGRVFTSPTPDQVKKAIDLLDAKETLLIVKNYTGDVMNFKIAADLAAEEGKKVDHVVVDDDIAVENSTWTEGKRGVAGTIFVHKIAGAAAEAGHNLHEVKKIAQKVIDHAKTIGIALEPCISVDGGKKSFELGDDQMEFGVGIHGEPGISKDKIMSSKEIVHKMMHKIFESHDFSNKEVAVMINGMGGTPLSELHIAQNDVAHMLHDKNVKVHKYFVGNYMTSLDMKGFSITLLMLDEELKKFLDHPAHTLGFK